ncbi:hypothetical protein JXI42_04600 [bacterium]|nr:hypothetical protein [bacterium]
MKVFQTILFLLLIVSTCAAEFIIDEKDSLIELESTRFKPNPTASLILSLAVPGGGQIYNRKYVKGACLILIESYLIYAIYDNQTIASDLLDLRDELDPESFEYAYYKGKFEKHIDARNDNIWLYIGVKLFSVVDAFVDAHLYTFDEEMNEKFTLDLTWKHQTPYLVLQIPFN